VSSASVSGGSSSSNRAVVIILAVLGVLALIAGIIYLVSTSVPSFMSAGSHQHTGHHEIRAIVSLVIGVVLLVGAWFAARRNSARSS
jgi:ribose/xylose/arabinose/galactoside ABC-type transport system permease subunit